MSRVENSKKYYETHKEEIAEKDKKRWVRYYEENKELIKKKNLERYYAKKVMNQPPPDADEEERKKREARLKEIITELHELLPKVVKVPRKRKAKMDPPEVGVVAPVIEIEV